MTNTTCDFKGCSNPARSNGFSVQIAKLPGQAIGGAMQLDACEDCTRNIVQIIEKEVGSAFGIDE